MTRLHPSPHRCPTPTCPSHLSRLPDLVFSHSRLKTRNGERRRRLCKACGRPSPSPSGRVCPRLRRSKADFDRVTQMQAEGMTKASIARVVGLSPSTVGRWLERGGRHAAAFNQVHVRVEDPVEFQLDELHCKGVAAAARTWAYSGLEVSSRLWSMLQVGNRTLRTTVLFTRQLARIVGVRSTSPLVGSDGFKYYRPAMRRIYEHTTLVYQQVDNVYARGRVVRTSSRLVLGTKGALEEARSRSEDSKRPNTSYIERLNLRKRMNCSFLRRRNAAPARRPEKIEQALELMRVFYNFVQRHSSLRFGTEKRTPAMQAGIFSRPLTIREIFSWVPPPPPAGRRRGAALGGRV